MAKAEGPVSRYINRRVSSRITSLIVSRGIGITPNQMSLIAFMTAAAAAASTASGMLALGGALVQLSSILDGVDGELARARRMTSPRGAFLDTVLDRYADLIILAAVAYAAYAGGTLGAGLVLALSLAAVTGDLMVSYIHARGVMDLGVHPGLTGPMDSIGSRDVRLFIVAVSLIAGHPAAALAGVALLSHSYSMVKFAYLTLKAPGPRGG